MTLYHATSTTHLDRILEEGLLPREITGISNWEHTAVPSREGMVYLTDRYILFYGASAAARANSATPVFFEVDVEPQRLLPDDDYLGHLSAKQTGIPLGISTNAVDIRACRDQWRDSLEVFGTVAHEGPISPEKIRRAVLLVDTAIWEAYYGFVPDGLPTWIFRPGPDSIPYGPVLRDLTRIMMDDPGQTTTTEITGPDGTVVPLYVAPGGREVHWRADGRTLWDVM